MNVIGVTDQRISPNARTEEVKKYSGVNVFVASARRCWCKNDSWGDLSFVSNFEESGILLTLKNLLM
jgi:hypothetical protein